jgi:hypothetical protein
MRPLSRREFFRTSAVFTLGAIVAACSKKAPTIKKSTLADVIRGHQQTLQMNTAGFEVLSNKPDRLVFNLIDPTNGNAITTPQVDLWIAKDQQSQAIGPLTASYKDEGLPKAKGFYDAPVTMPSDGTWLVVCRATRTGKTEPDFGAAQFQVGVQNAMPKQGDHAISVPSPTFGDHRGVSPICTRKPACSMHAISLDTALKNGKPTVLIIATPQFCQSALCGPEVDVVMDVSKDFRHKVNFVHIEVYKNDKPNTIQRQVLSPAAAAWRLEAEPDIYYIGPDGVIAARAVGPADESEVRAGVTNLLS